MKKEKNNYSFMKIRKALKDKENSSKARRMKRFFKEEVSFYGAERSRLAP